jgi:hypothetical protein
MKYARPLVVAVVFASVLSWTGTMATAAEGRVERPMYKNGPVRLDVCQQFGKNCGQAAADQYCQIMGYERATKFEGEPATPTKVIGSGRECKGSGCRGFKFIVCFTRVQERGKGHDWPPQVD